jgi:two-component system phosphate regulon response regulator PhoB
VLGEASGTGNHGAMSTENSHEVPQLQPNRTDSSAPDGAPLNKARVLMVTNDVTIGPVLEKPILEAGHEVTYVREGKRALELLQGDALPDVLIVDLTLPDMQAADLFRSIRSDRTTISLPILVVSSRSAEADRIAAFELGADDFVAAPFSVRELLLRVRVLIRSRNAANSASTGVLVVGSLRLDREAHRATADHQELSLSVREFGLLEALMERSERVLSRQFLLDTVWGPTTNVGVRAVDAYVTRLRRKLGPARDYVETVSSVGYRLKRPM